MTIGKKIATGFGVVLGLLVLASVLSYTGVGGIVHNAEEVINGNKLDGNLAQKEVDHLNWANKVCALLTSKTATKLDVQTDDHKCAFGKWLYGEGRKQAEAMVPALAPLLKAVEAPHHRLHQSAVGIGSHFKQADDKLPALLTSKVVDHLNWAGKIKDTLLENLPELKVQTDDHTCSLGKWLYSPAGKKAAASDPELASLLAALEKPHHQLHNSAKAIEKAYKPVHPGLEGLLKDRLDDHRRWVQQVAVGIMTGKKKLGVETDPAKCGLGKFINSAQGKKYMAEFPALKEAVEALAKPHKALHQSAVDIEKALAQGDTMQAQVIFDKVTVPSVEQVASHLQAAIHAEDKLVKGQEKALEIYNAQTLPALEKTQTIINKLVARAEKMLAGKNEANRIFSDQTTPALKETQALLHKVRAEARKHIMTDEVMLSAAQSTELNVTIVGVVAVIIGILLAWVIVRGITRVLRVISDTLGAGADQVAAAANEVSASSQSLAEGASEQAASLEETTSSMEEMSSMTKSNADNAAQADSLMDEAKEVVGRAGQSMGQMAESMSHISDAGEEISKIVKSIDEIAFQTNLLALNAAVEAARAGEAGAGFAVVADEVRNLAMRAADAAKNTQTLVEGTVTRINQGSELVDKTQNEFTQVTESAGKVAGLVSEIAAASGEQAEGIDQVNKAMVQMDQVVQVSAANSEEGASAAEELNAQAVVMKDTVAELLALVGGRQGGGKIAAKSAGSKKTKASKKANEDHPALPRPGAKEVKPEEAIPFDDDDFSDF